MEKLLYSAIRTVTLVSHFVPQSIHEANTHQGRFLQICCIFGILSIEISRFFSRFPSIVSLVVWRHMQAALEPAAPPHCNEFAVNMSHKAPARIFMAFEDSDSDSEPSPVSEQPSSPRCLVNGQPDSPCPMSLPAAQQPSKLAHDHAWDRDTVTVDDDQAASQDDAVTAVHAALQQLAAHADVPATSLRTADLCRCSANDIAAGILRAWGAMPTPDLLQLTAAGTGIQSHLQGWSAHYKDAYAAFKRMLHHIVRAVQDQPDNDEAVTQVQQCAADQLLDLRVCLCVASSHGTGTQRHGRGHTTCTSRLKRLREAAGHSMVYLGLLQAAAADVMPGDAASCDHEHIMLQGHQSTIEGLLDGFDAAMCGSLSPQYAMPPALVSRGAVSRLCMQLLCPTVREALVVGRAHAADCTTRQQRSWVTDDLPVRAHLLAAVSVAVVSKYLNNAQRRLAHVTLRTLCRLPEYKQPLHKLLHKLLHDCIGRNSECGSMHARSSLPALLLACSNDVAAVYKTVVASGRTRANTAMTLSLQAGNLQLMQLLVALGADIQGADKLLQCWAQKSASSGTYAPLHMLYWVKLQRINAGSLLPDGQAHMVTHRTHYKTDPHDFTLHAWDNLNQTLMKRNGFFLTPAQLRCRVEAFLVLHEQQQAVCFMGGHAHDVDYAATADSSAHAPLGLSAEDSVDGWARVQHKQKCAAQRVPPVLRLPASVAPPHKPAVASLRGHMQNQHYVAQLLDVVTEALRHAELCASHAGFTAHLPTRDGDSGPLHTGAAWQQHDAYAHLTRLLRRPNNDDELVAEDGSCCSDDSSVASFSDSTRLHTEDSGDLDDEDCASQRCGPRQSPPKLGGEACSATAPHSDHTRKMPDVLPEPGSIDEYCRSVQPSDPLQCTVWLLFHQMCARQDSVGAAVRAMVRADSDHGEKTSVHHFVRFMLVFPLRQYLRVLLHRRNNSLAHHAGYMRDVHSGLVLQTAVGAIGLLETLSMSGDMAYMGLRRDACMILRCWMHEQQTLAALRAAHPDAFIEAEAETGFGL